MSYGKLTYSFNLQINSIKCASLLDIYSVDAHKSIGDNLSAVGVDGVAEGLGNDVNTHARLQADAVGVDSVFYCYSE